MYSEKTPDDGHRNCPKHVEFYSKIKFEKLVHLVGFIIRIYHDARSPERQTDKLNYDSERGDRGHRGDQTAVLWLLICVDPKDETCFVRCSFFWNVSQSRMRVR